MEKDRDQLKFENELKKLKLRAEFGAQEVETNQAHLSAELESQFLDYVQAFEEAAAGKKVVKVFDLLDHPEVPALDSIPQEKISICLNYLLQILASKNIYVDSIYEVPARELYRFIVEDLFAHEMNLVDVPGLRTHFTYEEFYPNHIEDLKEQACETLSAAFRQNISEIEHQLWNTMTYHGETSDAKDFMQWLETKMIAYQGQLIHHQATQVSISEHKAQVPCELQVLEGVINSVYTAPFGFRFDYGYWYMQDAELPFLN